MGNILLFYKYVHIINPKKFTEWQTKLCKALNLRGRLLIAHEGINGTLGGSISDTQQYEQIMLKLSLFKNMDIKKAPGSAEDFPRLRIATRNTIVNLGIDPEQLTVSQTGTHLAPQEVHELLLNKPDNLVILDARNMVESAVGKFTDALTPKIRRFRDLPEYIDNNSDLFKDKQVLMYCTGGVRCERATAYLKEKNIAEKVFQVEGGIHRYVEQYPDGFFRGKNYVFDNRITAKINDDILGTCAICSVAYDDYTNCLNALCNKHFICCNTCKNNFANTCSLTCKTLIIENKVPQRPLFGQQTVSQQQLYTQQQTPSQQKNIHDTPNQQ